MGFTEAEEKSNSLTLWFPISVLSIYTAAIGTSFYTSFARLYSHDYDTTQWGLPYFYYNLLPFDETTVGGWYLELFIQLYGGYAYMFTITSTISFFGGCAYYIEACHLQIKHMFSILDEMNKQNVNLEKLDDHVNNIITFHNKILE